MNFIQHIQEIDKCLEQRKEEEYQNSLFGIEGGIDVEGAMAMSISHYQYVPNPGGARGGTRIRNGKIISTSVSDGAGGYVRTKY